MGGRVITRSAFEEELKLRARRAPGQYVSDEARTRLMETMIRQEALIAKARAQGFDRRPETVAGVDQLIASRFREAEFARLAQGAAAVDEGHILRYYQAKLGEFSVPTSVRAGVIVIPVPPKALPAKREEVRVGAEAIRSEAMSASDAAFRQLVQQHSGDQSSRYTGGDTGWLAEDETSSRWPFEICRVAFTLTNRGDVGPLVETRQGLCIVRLTDRREAGVRPIEEVRESIAYRLQREHEQALQQRFYEELKQGIEITINDSLLQSIGPSTSVQTASAPALPGG